MKTTKLILSIAAATLAVTALAGCTQAALVTSASTPNATVAAPSASPTTAADPTSIAGLTLGAKLTDAQAKALSKDFTNSNRPYQTTDGSWVLVNRDQPLPANVAADIAAIAGSKYTVDPTNKAAVDAIASARSTTGRSIVAVIQILVDSGPDNAPKVLVWTAMTGHDAAMSYSSRDEAYAAAVAIVASKSDPAKWDIVG